MTVAEASDSITEGGRADEQAVVQVLTALGSQTDRDTPQPDVLLPAYCPAVDSPEVTALRVAPTYARGGDDGAGKWWCLYRDTTKGIALKVLAFHFTDEYLATFYDDTGTNPNGVDMFDGPPGPIRMVSLGEDGSADSILLDPDTRYYVNANLLYAEQKQRKANRQGIIDLVQSSFDSISTSDD